MNGIHLDGSLTNYFEHASDFVFKLPDHVSLDEGALLEPLSVGIHACERGQVGVGSTVLILGAGPIGLVSLLVARACGATTILVTGKIPCFQPSYNRFINW